MQSDRVVSMNARLLISLIVGALAVIAWFLLFSLGLSINPESSEGVAVLWCSGCILGAPLGRTIKRDGDGYWGVQSSLFGLLGLGCAAAAYGISMVIGAAPVWAVVFGGLSGAVGCLLSSRSS